MSAIVTVQVDGQEYSMDVERITFGEARMIEDVTGKPFSTKGDPSVAQIQALTWIIMRRSDKTLKFSSLDDRAITDFSISSESAPDPAAANPTSPAAA